MARQRQANHHPRPVGHPLDRDERHHRQYPARSLRRPLLGPEPVGRWARASASGRDGGSTQLSWRRREQRGLDRDAAYRQGRSQIWDWRDDRQPTPG
ncbi:hypothetical protein G6F31_018615 [Rhizopus arrhizus]|nr:hypothetical protein G6F32_015033 [Rhizopus arrhizus]KAG0925799.1 hypothetical protein G6F31_018615 [Rhizopus arrhizus]